MSMEEKYRILKKRIRDEVKTPDHNQVKPPSLDTVIMNYFSSVRNKESTSFSFGSLTITKVRTSKNLNKKHIKSDKYYAEKAEFIVKHFSSESTEEPNTLSFGSLTITETSGKRNKKVTKSEKFIAKKSEEVIMKYFSSVKTEEPNTISFGSVTMRKNVRKPERKLDSPSNMLKKNSFSGSVIDLTKEVRFNDPPVVKRLRSRSNQTSRFLF